MSLQSTTSITKLQPDGLNYGYWSAYLEALLEENNICLTDDMFANLRADNTKTVEYKKTNGMAKRIIMQTVAHSTEEAEFKAFAQAISDLKWCVGLIKELNLKIHYPIPCYTDNQACLKSLTNQNYKGRSKHNEIHYNIVRDEISKRKLDVQYVESDNNLADMFTKVLPPSKLKYLKSSLNT